MRQKASIANEWVAELLTFLGDPASYEPRPAAVKIVQTHASVVALAGELVYKVKKPVNFGFLDYSTLERRRHFCHREVELNRRLCPEVYLGVLPIVQRNGRLCFGVEGGAEQGVEYAVHMRRLSEEHLLSSILQRKEASEHDIRRIVNVLVPFYAGQPPAAGFGTIEQVRDAVVGNLDLCARAVGPILPELSHEALRHFTDQFLTKHASVFGQRAADGRIRDGHGDLRPMHIHLAADCVRIYDCIEFNDNLRCIDVAADVAFLAMELDFAGHLGLADRFLQWMREGLADSAVVALTAFYQCYRAAVRGKVAWLLANESESPIEQRTMATEEARAYFQLALRYALFGQRRAVLCVMGRIGTGKSTLASALGDLLGCPVFSSDRIRKELARVSLYTRPGGPARERLYSEKMHYATYVRLADRAATSLKSSRVAIVDATFNQKKARRMIAETVAAREGRVLFMEVTASDALIRSRLASRAGATDVISDARLEDFDRLQRTWSPPTELPAEQILRIDGARPLEQLVREVLHWLMDSIAVE